MTLDPRGDILSRILPQFWIWMQLNGGKVDDPGTPPDHDDLVRLSVPVEEGALHLDLTRDRYADRPEAFMKVSVALHGTEGDYHVRVDDAGGQLHYDIELEGDKVEEHVPLDIQSPEKPLKYATSEAVRIFEEKFGPSGDLMTSLDEPPAEILGNILTVDPELPEGSVELPVVFPGYPGSEVDFKGIATEPTTLNLRPLAFVLEDAGEG